MKGGIFKKKMTHTFMLLGFLIVLGLFVFICRISPPRFTSESIVVQLEGQSEVLVLKNDDLLVQKINSWLMKKRWCYPSLVSYCPKTTLQNNEESPLFINIWDDRIIFQYEDGMQYVTFFFTKSDARIKREIEECFWARTNPSVVCPVENEDSDDQPCN